MAPPDFLVAGHIVKDITPHGWTPGGSVLYAAAQARALGRRVAAVTVAADDVQPDAILPEVDWYVAPAGESTAFENRYAAGRREQRVTAVARPLALEDIPLEWRGAPTVFLGPVLQDIDRQLPRQLGDGSLLGLGAQGWLRQLDSEGRVCPGAVQSEPDWLGGDVVFVSDEDVDDPEAVASWQQTVPIVVLTRGRQGCTLWDREGRHDLPALEAEEVDPTGAGDVFAAAFLIAYRETGEAGGAARFAAAASALSVRSFGLGGIGDRKAIETLLSGMPAKTR